MNLDPNQQPAWGLSVADVQHLLRSRYWCYSNRLKLLLKSGIAGADSRFPLRISLKPPSGKNALHNMLYFQAFIDDWKILSTCIQQDSPACQVVWQERRFQTLLQQQLPVALMISDIRALAWVLGEKECQQLQQWQSRIAFILDGLKANGLKTDVHQQQVFNNLIDHLDVLEQFHDSDLELLVRLIPQLYQGMGQDCYLRALPVVYVDTKFIENNFRLIESVVAGLYGKTCLDEGLLAWLGCQDKPKDWLLVRPLCHITRSALGGLPILRLSSDILKSFQLPAKNILVIENEQSCLCLESIPNTIAVAGGGKNTVWMSAPWLLQKHVGYWGDLDSEGLAILSDARKKHSSLISLMMNQQVLEEFQDRMVDEPRRIGVSRVQELSHLTSAEQSLLQALQTDKFGKTRLEQERLPIDYIHLHLRRWAQE